MTVVNTSGVCVIPSINSWVKCQAVCQHFMCKASQQTLQRAGALHCLFSAEQKWLSMAEL